MRAVTGKPIKFVGTGEKLDGLELFQPSRVAGRILGMGDVVSLVERAAETIKVEDAEKLAERMSKGQFDLNDLRGQLNQMRKMGGLGALASMLPGIAKVKNAMANGAVDDKVLIHMDAIIGSMTPKERAKPELLNAKRKIRVAKGSGTTVQDVNKILKMHQEMATMMKKMKKMGGLKGLAAMFGKGGMGGAGGMGGLGGLGGPGGGMPPAAGRRARWSAGVARRAGAAARFPEFHEEEMSPAGSLNELREGRIECPFRSVCRVVVPRSVPIIASSSPTRPRRAMAPSSRRSAPTIRCSPRATRSA